MYVQNIPFFSNVLNKLFSVKHEFFPNSAERKKLLLLIQIIMIDIIISNFFIYGNFKTKVYEVIFFSQPNLERIRALLSIIYLVPLKRMEYFLYKCIIIYMINKYIHKCNFIQFAQMNDSPNTYDQKISFHFYEVISNTTILLSGITL